MTTELFLALLVFAGVGAWTPGPNNAILLASGINYGFRRSLPMILGVAFGFPFMIGAIGLGLGKIFEANPAIYTALKYTGAAYMLWLAWKILTSKPAGEVRSDAQPLNFIQAALFQWINPKGWVLALTVISAYTLPSAYYASVTVIVLTFVFMGLTSGSAWTMFGASLRHIMNDPRYFRWINIGLAAALVASLIPMLRH